MFLGQIFFHISNIQQWEILFSCKWQGLTVVNIGSAKIINWPPTRMPSPTYKSYWLTCDKFCNKSVKSLHCMMTSYLLHDNPGPGLSANSRSAGRLCLHKSIIYFQQCYQVLGCCYALEAWKRKSFAALLLLCKSDMFSFKNNCCNMAPITCTVETWRHFYMNTVFFHFSTAWLCQHAAIVILWATDVRCHLSTSVKLIFSETFKWINAKLCAKVCIHHISRQIFFFKIFDFEFQ